MNKMRPRKTREQWAELIEQQQQSGLTILDFCQQYDVGFASFGKWKRRLSAATAQTARPSNKAVFTAVSVNRTPTPTPVVQGAATITLNIGGEMTLTIVNPSADT